LIKCRTLIGLTRDEVVDLLGKPDWGGRAPGWETGPERRWLSLDNEILLVRLARDRRVRRVSLTPG
jgi:hypothetical protein